MITELTEPEILEKAHQAIMENKEIKRMFDIFYRRLDRFNDHLTAKDMADAIVWELRKQGIELS